MNIQWQGILGESTVRLPGVSEFALGNKFWWWCYQVWGSHLFRFGSCWWPCKSKTCHWPRAPCNTSCGSWCTTLDPWMTGSSNGNRIFTTWWVSLWRCGRLPSIWSSCWILWCFWQSLAQPDLFGSHQYYPNIQALSFHSLHSWCKLQPFSCPRCFEVQWRTTV